MESLARSEARSSWQRDTIYRAWAATLIGSYVPLTESMPPNPYLIGSSDNDLGATSGKSSILINPAYMTRKAHDLGAERFGPVSHITSLRPKNRANAPDSWEKGAFAAFGKGAAEVSSVEPINGKPHMRLMRPVLAETGCLKCHEAQGYKEGDVLGGISISIPMEPFFASRRGGRWNDLIAVGLLWLVGAAAIFGGGLRIARDLGQVLHSEKALRKERDRAQSYLDTVEAIIVALDDKGRISSINRKGCQLLGRGERDLVGLDWFSACLPQPEGKGTVFPRFLELMKGDVGPTEYYENSIVTATGEIREIAWHNSLLRDENGRITGSLSAGEDITGKKRLQDEVRKKSDFLASILKNSPDGIIGNDSAGNIFLFNEAAERIYGYTASEAIGKIRAAALYPPGGAREVKEFIYAEGFGGRGRLQDFETKIVTKKGALVPIRLSCELIYEDGREIGTIGFFHDISGRLALQDHLAESEAKFRTLFETASDAILGIGEDGLILLANRAAKDVFEYPGNEIVGINVRRLLGARQEGTWEILSKYAPRPESGKYLETSAVSRSGKAIPFHVSISESGSAGKKLYTAIMRDVSEIKEYEENLQVLANTDSLTRLFNRRQLYPILQNELDRAVRTKIPFSVLMMDIDHFKRFNDTHGHAGGDLLLAGFADKIRDVFRKMDSAFRFGGEEFIVLLPETTSRDGMIPAERFRQRIADSVFHMPPDAVPVSVTVSVGIAEFRDGDSIDEVIRRADLAMYAAKKGGRNQVVDYDRLTSPESP